MKKVISDCWNHFTRYKNQIGIDRSIPILYFGDLSGYKKSKIKIITASLNPSSSEFSKNKGGSGPYSFIRFKQGEELYQSELLDDTKIELYMSTLNNYFKDEPYTKWFNNLEPILNGLNGSYYDKIEFPNRVLHTDICTPLATNPKWSDFGKVLKDALQKEGSRIWHSLVEELEPDIILLSVGSDNMQYLDGSKISNRIVYKRYDYKVDGTLRSNPYFIEIMDYSTRSKKVAKIIYGNQRVQPFCDLGRRKLDLGRQLFTDYFDATSSGLI